MHLSTLLRQPSIGLPLPNSLQPQYPPPPILSVYVPSPRVCFKSQSSRVRYPVRPHTFVSPSADSSRAVVSFWRKYVHKELVNRLGGLSLPRKSAGKLNDRPDMTIDVYHGRKNNNITLTPDKDLQNDSQTNIHSKNVRRHDSSPNNKHPQSVSHPKPGPTQDPLFFVIFTSQNKVFTQTGNGGRSYQYTR